MSVESRLTDVEESLRLFRNADRFQGRRMSAEDPADRAVIAWDDDLKKYRPLATASQFARATDNLTLTTGAQSITGDGDSSKVRLLLPNIGDWLVVGIFDFDVTATDPNACVGRLFVDDSGTAEDGDAVLWPGSTGANLTGRGTASQQWKVTTTTADTPVELKAFKSGAGGTALAKTTSTTILAVPGLGNPGTAAAATDHGGLTGLGDDDHTIYIKADGSRDFAGEQSMGTNKLTNVVDPTADQEAATKKYVDDNDHNESHTVASHSDTTGTGAELETLTDGSETALHSHAGGGGSGTMTTVKEDGSGVGGADIVTLDFLEPDATLVSEDPDTEININMALYTLLSGRSGGQSLIGGTGSGDDLTLESTSDATKGTIIFEDDLRMNQADHAIVDSSGEDRIAFTTNYGHLATFGDVDAAGAAVFRLDWTGTATSGTGRQSMSAGGTLTYSSVPNANPTIWQAIASISGSGTTTWNQYKGLHVQLAISNLTTSRIWPIYIHNAGLPATQNTTEVSKLYIATQTSGSLGVITNMNGIYILDQAPGLGAVTVAGLRINDQVGATNNYCLEIGTSPMFRVLGSFGGDANETPVYILEGATPTLRQLKTKAGDTLDSGDLVCVLE